MPNHVHWLVETVEGNDLGRVMQSVKGCPAREINRLLGRSGSFWQREYFDRAVRDPEHLRRAVEYIHNNPVKARLVSTAEQWRWSSAWHNRLGHLPL
jgi:REP element-mobilizing transposase RayT